MIELSFEKKLKSSSGSLRLNVQKEISKGEFIAIYGKSGAGKTSTLRIIAGLLQPDKGNISLAGNVLLQTEQKIFVPPQKREIGLVFQNYALFPNMTVIENLRFALRKNQSEKILDELIEMMEISGLKNQKPNQLSGGQQQRVAVARALVQRPKLLLLDEPFSSIDNSLRHKLQSYLTTVHKEFNLTTIIVSHNQAEVLKLSDRLWVIDDGVIIYDGKTIDYFSPNFSNTQFQTTGEIISFKHEAQKTFVLVLIGNDIAKIEVEEEKKSSFVIGQKVMLESKEGNFILKSLTNKLGKI